jgi:hypothetical protein
LQGLVLQVSLLTGADTEGGVTVQALAYTCRVRVPPPHEALQPLHGPT